MINCWNIVKWIILGGTGNHHNGSYNNNKHFCYYDIMIICWDIVKRIIIGERVIGGINNNKHLLHQVEAQAKANGHTHRRPSASK